MIDGIRSLSPGLGVDSVQGGNALRGTAQDHITAGAGFGSALTQIAADAIQTMKTAEATSISGIQGKLPAQKVVEAVLAAEQTLQSAVAIRDKAVNSYLELTRMAI
jgi:flagellar hook-basal body complex protein FliE